MDTLYDTCAFGFGQLLEFGPAVSVRAHHIVVEGATRHRRTN